MRAQEFLREYKEKFNQDVMKPGFKFSQEINGVVYKVINKIGMPEMLALDKQGQVIGAATFWKHPTQDGLESLSTHVDQAWQGRGIAANMYAVMRMLGVNISPSSNRTNMGKAMWAKWSRQGDAKHLKNLNPRIKEQTVTEGTLSVDVPNEAWLQDKIDYAKSKGRNSFGVPYMGSTTASVRGAPPRVRVMRLASLPGMRNEQTNVRRDDLKWLMNYMERTGKLPPMGSNPNEEYLPYIMVAYNGEAWVNEGNHRIMAAYRLNWQDMPVEIRYFDGGERVKDGAMYPGKIGLGEVDVPRGESIAEVFEPGKQNWKWRRQSSDEAFASFLVGDREYQWHAFSSEANPTKWEIQFRLMRASTDPDGLDLFGQTGTGNSAEVLSTAVDITRSFLQNYGLDKVEEITFNAKEDSRINLYAKMIRRLLPNWHLSSRKSPSHGMQFTLTDPGAYDKPDKIELGKPVTESQKHCPECGGPMFSELIMNEKKDACYYKVKSRYKVWPSAYASGALVQCRKKGADNWGDKK